MSTNFLYSKVCWQCPAMFCLYTSKKTFPTIIWIFTEGEDDGIEFRLPFKIFSTLQHPAIFFSTFKSFDKKLEIGQKFYNFELQNKRVWKKDFVIYYMKNESMVEIFLICYMKNESMAENNSQKARLLGNSE